MRKRLNTPKSPPSKSPSPSSAAKHQGSIANHAAADAAAAADADADVDLLQFKPINSTTIDLSEKKATHKAHKQLEAERVLAGLKMGVCTLVSDAQLET